MYTMRDRTILTKLERKSSWHTALTTEGKVLGATLATTSSLALLLTRTLAVSTPTCMNVDSITIWQGGQGGTEGVGGVQE